RLRALAIRERSTSGRVPRAIASTSSGGARREGFSTTSGPVWRARTDVLEPDDRLLLLDALRPPAGYAFDRAGGTSFTLDLHALLTTPLALAAFDWEASDGGIPDDPLALLESLRRCSDRIDFFCQAGEISIPPAYHRLYSWLEGSVHEAVPARDWA